MAQMVLPVPLPMMVPLQLAKVGIVWGGVGSELERWQGANSRAFDKLSYVELQTYM